MEAPKITASDFEAAAAGLFANIDPDEPSVSPFEHSFFDKVRGLLSAVGKEEWSKRPRTYTVLRLINRVDALDGFVIQGFLDIQFPYVESQLPTALSTASSRSKFLTAQRLVLSAAKAAEFGTYHQHFSSDANECFFVVKQLGGGSFGVVDHVTSKLSLEQYARKRISRRNTFHRDRIQMKVFINELMNLKRLKHEHLVRFIGSYTDPRYIGILMDPIADCDLKTFLSQKPFPPGGLALLRRSFGCLCAAVQYLHDNKCRHKDIKPANILVKGDKMLITDFGTARDWSDRSKGTTVGPVGPHTQSYAAPEVVEGEPRGNPADIWSLGCVYLDIMTVLKGHSLEDRMTFFETHGTGMKFPRTNREAYELWLERLHSTNDDNPPLEWIKQMLAKGPRQRVSAIVLLERIQVLGDGLYCGDCCTPHYLSDEASIEESEFEKDSTVAPSTTATIYSHPIRSSPWLAVTARKEVEQASSHISRGRRSRGWWNIVF